MSVRVPDERLYRIELALSWVPRSYRDPAEADLADLVADLQAARADNQRLREALGEIVALRLKEDSDSEHAVNDARMTMRGLARAALVEEPRA